MDKVLDVNNVCCYWFCCSSWLTLLIMPDLINLMRQFFFTSLGYLSWRRSFSYTFFFLKNTWILEFSVCSLFGRRLCQKFEWAELYLRTDITEPTWWSSKSNGWIDPNLSDSVSFLEFQRDELKLQHVSLLPTEKVTPMSCYIAWYYIRNSTRSWGHKRIMYAVLEKNSSTTTCRKQQIIIFYSFFGNWQICKKN